MAQMVWQPLLQPHMLSADAAFKTPELDIIYDRDSAAET